MSRAFCCRTLEDPEESVLVFSRVFARLLICLCVCVCACPQGWLYLLSCHAVLGGAASAGDNTGPWNFYIHVPLVYVQHFPQIPQKKKKPPKIPYNHPYLFVFYVLILPVFFSSEGGAAAASPWMGKLARRVTGDYGTHHVSAPLAADKDAVAEEEVEVSECRDGVVV